MVRGSFQCGEQLAGSGSRGVDVGAAALAAVVGFPFLGPPVADDEYWVAGVQRLEGLRARYKDRFTLRYLPSKGRPSHVKVLICDAEYFILTSFNWLSFKGDEGRAFRNEQGVILLAEKNSDVSHLREDTTGLPLAEARTQYVEELP